MWSRGKERKERKEKERKESESLVVKSSFFAHRSLFVYLRLYYMEGSLLSLTQAILIRISYSLYNIPNIVNTKMFTDFEGTDTQTDSRTDRHDVTLEATPS